MTLANDMIQNYSVSTAYVRLAALVDQIFATVPGVSIVLSNLPPNGHPAAEANAQIYNAQIPGVVSRRAAVGKKITFVDMHSNWFSLADIGPDGIHPTDLGYLKMAKVFHNGIQALQSQITPPLAVSGINDTAAISMNDAGAETAVDLVCTPAPEVNPASLPSAEIAQCGYTAWSTIKTSSSTTHSSSALKTSTTTTSSIITHSSSALKTSSPTPAATCSVVSPSPSGSKCGVLGFSHDSTPKILAQYTNSSSYVISASACGAQCFAASNCTNIYFKIGTYCNLHYGASTFGAGNATGAWTYYDAQCFLCQNLTTISSVSSTSTTQSSSTGQFTSTISTSGTTTSITT